MDDLVIDVKRRAEKLQSPGGLEKAIAQYDAFDYAEARKGFLAVAETGADHERAQALFYLGLIAASTGDPAEATRRFGEALAIEEVTSPPGTSPQILELVEEARRKPR